MKKILLSLVFIKVVVFANDIGMICTLTEENGQEINERRAQTLDKFEKIMIKTDTKLFMEGEFEKYYLKTSPSGIDIYNDVFGIGYYDSNKKVYFISTNDTKHFYECRNPTFVEKGKIEFERIRLKTTK